MKFLESQHRGKKKCLADAAKLPAKGSGRLKNSLISSFLVPASAVAKVPSQTQAPAPVVVPNNLPLESVPSNTKNDDVPELGSDSDDSEDEAEKNKPNVPPVTFYKTPLANTFQGLVDNLPAPANMTDLTDSLSALASDPAQHDNRHINNDEIWEEVLNPLLKGILGWGTSLDVEAVVKGPREGLMGIPAFIEYFVQRRGVSEGLFEGKLSHLMAGMAGMQRPMTCVPFSTVWFLDEIVVECRLC